MLLRIDKTVSEVFSAGLATLSDRQAVQYLAMAAMEGSHRISGERETLDLLALSLDGLPRHARAFRRASERITEEGNLHKSLTVYGVVTIQDEAVVPWSSKSGQQRIIHFPLSWFDDSSKVHKVHLLAENGDDVDVYLIMALLGALSASTEHVPLALEPGHGSGSNIAAVLQKEFSKQQMVLCLVDSDKLSPQGEIGGTAKSLRTFENETNNPLIQVDRTSSRDLENVLPNVFFNKAYGKGRHRSMSAFLTRLSEHGETTARAHLDIKNGLKLRDIFEMAEGTPDRQFWLEKIPVLDELSEATVKSEQCLISKVCAQTTRRNCTCEVVSGNPSTILFHFNERYKGLKAVTLKSALGEQLSEEWDRLGRLIASWGCADQVLRV